MPIHVTTRNKRDVVTFLSDVDADFVSLVDHGANWTPFASIKHDFKGVHSMPGQVIQAIIMPLEKDITELERLYGQEWFGRVNTAKREECADTVKYVQRDESDFEEFQRDLEFVLEPIADTGGSFVVGTLKSGTGNEPALEVPGPPPPSDDRPVETRVGPNDDKGDHCMTVDEVRNLIAESTAAAEARMTETLQKRLLELDREPAAGTGPDNGDIDDSAGKSVDGGSLKRILGQLDELSAQVRQIAEKQDALEHAAVGRRSSPEDPVIRGGAGSPFRGMFAGL